jgi:hypothetical protein
MPPDQSKPLRPAHYLLAVAFFFAWYFLVVDGLWGYSQYLLIKKKVLPGSLFVMFLGAVTLLFRRPKDNGYEPRIMPILYALWCWMLIVLIMGSQDPFASPGKVLFGLYVNYYYFYLAVFAVNSSFRIQEGTFLRLFFITAIPVVCLGVAQGIMQDNFAIGKWIAQEASAFNLGFYGKRRANGAFAHAEDFGFYCGIVMSLATALWLNCRQLKLRLLWSLLIALCLLAIYFTLTRATYLMAGYAIAATVLIHRAQGKESSFLTWLPVVFLGLSTAIFFAAPLVSMLANTDTVLSSASLNERLYGNQYYLSELQHAGWHSFLTGLGWYINGHYRANFAIDNQFVALLISIGAVGLTLWCILTSLLWRNMLSRALASRSPTLIGLAGACSPWLAQSIFNVTSTLAFVAIAGLVIQHTSKDEAASSAY